MALALPFVGDRVRMNKLSVVVGEGLHKASCAHLANRFRVRSPPQVLHLPSHVRQCDEEEAHLAHASVHPVPRPDTRFHCGLQILGRRAGVREGGGEELREGRKSKTGATNKRKECEEPSHKYN